MSDFPDMTGRVALVTGASRGIGLAVAQQLARRGAHVVMTARGEEDLHREAAAIGDRAAPLAGPIGDPAHREALFELALSRWGRIDYLVNNVGINPVFGPIETLEHSASMKILETNVLAATHLVQLAIRNGIRENRGAIVNIASIAALAASPGIGMYGVSKSALLGLTRQFAVELAPEVRVNAVAPAAVRTRFSAALLEGGREADLLPRYPLARVGEPDDIAQPVVFLLSDAAAWMTGQTLVIDGGASLLVGE